MFSRFTGDIYWPVLSGSEDYCWIHQGSVMVLSVIVVVFSDRLNIIKAVTLKWLAWSQSSARGSGTFCSVVAFPSLSHSWFNSFNSCASSRSSGGEFHRIHFRYCPLEDTAGHKNKMSFHGLMVKGFCQIHPLSMNHLIIHFHSEQGVRRLITYRAVFKSLRAKSWPGDPGTHILNVTGLNSPYMCGVKYTISSLLAL